MSNILRRMAKQQKRKEWKQKRKANRLPPKKYTSFNIFTQYGKNRVVTTDRPMTIVEAQYKFKALSISGNE